MQWPTIEAIAAMTPLPEGYRFERMLPRWRGAIALRMTFATRCCQRVALRPPRAQPDGPARGLLASIGAARRLACIVRRRRKSRNTAIRRLVAS